MAGSGELWRCCSNWLCDLEIINRTDSANVSEFASILRDGVVLCRLANKLIPNSIDQARIRRTQQSQFFCVKNISLFLEVCTEQLKIDKEKLFEAPELYSMTGFHKVLNTLSVLSHTRAALALAKPFPEESTSTADVIESTAENNEDTIYKSLKDDVENIDPDATTYGNVCRSEEEEEKQSLYDHIVARRDSQRERDEWSSFVPTTRREHCIKELLDTEQNFVEKALRMITNNFYQPLKIIMSEEDHKIIFNNIMAISTFHNTFYADLRQAVLRTLNVKTNGGTSRPNSLCGPQFIGSVFVQHKERLVIYGQYCTHLNEARNKITEIENKDQRLAAKIMECAKSVSDNQFKLQDLLFVPMQRVLKYKILLQELLRNTDADSPDKAAIIEGLEAMEDVNCYVNEMKRDFDSRQCTATVEKSITDLAMPDGVRLVDYGRLNMDAEVRMSESCGNQNGKTKQRFVFIFDKVLIICKQNKNGTYTYKTAYILSELSVDPNITVEARNGGTIGKRNNQHVLHLHKTKENSDDVHIQFFFKNAAQRQKWLDVIMLSKDNVQPMSAIENTHHVVHFTTFRTDTVQNCYVCKMLMKGLYFQGYKCEVCKQSFHKECLSAKRCEGRRVEHRTSQSFSCSRPRLSVVGDIVVASQRFHPSDLAYLAFDKDDRIEIVQIHSDNIILGCLLNHRQRKGLVKLDCVRRYRGSSITGISPAITPDSPTHAARIDRKESTQLPRRPDQLLRPSGSNSVPSLMAQEYVNTDVSSQPWYMGNMDRQEAERKLSGTPNGTFLVRNSSNLNKQALSMNHEGTVKHMKIDRNSNGQYFLDEEYIFNSIVELISYYKVHNLREIFKELNGTLKNAYRECKVYRIIHDYDAPEAKFLSLRKGETVTLIDTIGEDRGWWKGEVDNRVGFFPLSYVKEIREGEEF